MGFVIAESQENLTAFIVILRIAVILIHIFVPAAIGFTVKRDRVV